MRTRGDSILLDTSVIVALLDSKDSLHEQSVAVVKENASKRFCILQQIVGETYSVIARRCRERKYDCKEAISRVRELEQRCIILNAPFHQYHERVVEKLRKNCDLNYNDWLLVLFAKENSLNILSLDRKLLEEFWTNEE